MSTIHSPSAGSSGPAAGKLTRSNLKRARELFHATGDHVQFAYEFGYANEAEALKAIGRSLGMPTVDLSNVESITMPDGFPIRLIHRHAVFPLAVTDDSIRLALGNPFDVQAIDAVSAATGRTADPVLAVPGELATLIKTQLGVGAQTIDGLIAASDDQVEVLGDLNFDESEAAELAQQASVVRLVNDILTEAVVARASDIHMEIQTSGLKIRYRIDGVLRLNRFRRNSTDFRRQLSVG
jgi:type II secretory ATPase GspE/PulE/Tfp pilus assembly ATPase PilB-like protein